MCHSSVRHHAVCHVISKVGSVRVRGRRGIDVGRGRPPHPKFFMISSCCCGLFCSLEIIFSDFVVAAVDVRPQYSHSCLTSSSVWAGSHSFLFTIPNLDKLISTFFQSNRPSSQAFYNYLPPTHQHSGAVQQRCAPSHPSSSPSPSSSPPPPSPGCPLKSSRPPHPPALTPCPPP